MDPTANVDAVVAWCTLIHMPEDSSPSADARDRLRNAVGIATTVLLSISALGTSWAGYQSTLWSGTQNVLANQSLVLHTRSTRASARADQLRAIDVGLFTNWLAAAGIGKSRLADFEAHRFRPEFVPAFRKWIDSHPLRNGGAAPTPFTLPEYHLALDDEAARTDVAGDSLTALSNHANSTGDAYVLDAVIFAMVMFFAGAAQQPASNRLRVVLASMAFVICCAALYRLISLPRG